MKSTQILIGAGLVSISLILSLLALQSSKETRLRLSGEVESRSDADRELTAEFEELRTRVDDLEGSVAALRGAASSTVEPWREELDELRTSLEPLLRAIEEIPDPQLRRITWTPEPSEPPPLPETVRLLDRDEIPEHLRGQIEPNTILVAGPENLWGQFRIRINGANIPLQDRVGAEAMALLYAESEVVEARVCETLIDAGHVPVFDSFRAASEHANVVERGMLRAGLDFRGYRIYSYGSQFAVIRSEQVHDHPDVASIQERISTLGRRFMDGNAGYYGVRWSKLE